MDTELLEQITKDLAQLNEEGLKFVASVCEYTARNESFNKSTTAERLAELEKIEEEKKQAQAVQFMQEKEEAEKSPICRLIDYQYIEDIAEGGRAFKDFKELVQASRYERELQWTFAKFYLLGKIYGKRELRAKKH